MRKIFPPSLGLGCTENFLTLVMFSFINTRTKTSVSTDNATEVI
jgi:hypothetical protein